MREVFLHTKISAVLNKQHSFSVLLAFTPGLEGNDRDTGCKVLTKSDYIHIVWTTCAEFPGQPRP